MEISNEDNKLKENKPKEEEEQLITDFSQMFKNKGFAKKPPKLSNRQPEQIPNWLLEIPAKIELTKEEMCMRKVMNQKRWMSMAKANEQSLKIVASVVSAWNFLFSNKGSGNLLPLAVKQAVQIYEANNIIYRANAEKSTTEMISQCFELICKHFNVQGSAKVLYKPSLPLKVQKSEEQVLDQLFQGLKNNNTAYILTTYNNILYPIGYDITPLVPLDAYKKLEDIKPQNSQLWIISASTNRKDPSFVSKRWKNIKQSLETVWPYYLDLEQPKKGPIKYAEATVETQTQQRGSQFSLIELRSKCV